MAGCGAKVAEVSCAGSLPWECWKPAMGALAPATLGSPRPSAASARATTGVSSGGMWKTFAAAVMHVPRTKGHRTSPGLSFSSNQQELQWSE